MSYEVRITKIAERDIKDASNYIEYSIKNRTAAYHLVDDAIRAVYSLADSPARFQLVVDPRLASWGIRYVIVHNYLAFYVIDEIAAIVYVVRFLYQGSNWKEILRQGISVM